MTAEDGAAPSRRGVLAPFRGPRSARLRARAEAPRSGRFPETRSVCHFGPSVADVGGMATVLRVFAAEQVGGRVEVRSTWSARGRLRTLLAAARSAVRLLRLPRTTVVHVHLSYGGSFLREGGLVALSRALGHCTIANLHGSRFPAFAARRPELVGRVLRRASCVCVLSEESLHLVRGLAPRTAAVLIPNPMRMDPAAPVASSAPPVAFFAGEIGWRKGVDVLLAAWPAVRAAVPDGRLILMGPRTMPLPELPDGVEVRDPGAPAVVRETLRCSRVAVLPSRAEAMPMFLLEAQAARRPVVATPVGGVPALVARGGGALVPVDDAAALAEAVQRLLVDGEAADRLGAEGAAACAAACGTAVVDEAYRSLYARLLPA